MTEASAPRRAASGSRLDAVVLGLAVLMGGALWLPDLTRSLWIDEFGTLWVVEGTLATAWDRALAFQGQSPLPYVITWLALQGLGESEVALRLPAIVAGLLAVFVLDRVCRELAGARLARWCAALALTSALVIDASRSARPYALALLMAALALLGFLRAVRGARGGRGLFVLGGVGLFYAHYVLATFIAGLAVAYLLRPELRRRYAASGFAVDLGVQALLALPGLVHLHAIHARAGMLSWVEEPSPAVFLIVAWPYLLPIAAGWFLPAREEARRTRAAAEALLIALGAQLLLLVSLPLAGIVLTKPRYAITIAVPAIVLAARGIWLVLSERSAVRFAIASMLGLLYLATNLQQRDRLGVAVSEDWRGAVTRMDAMYAETPAPVLYRSGFVEDDQRVDDLDVTDAVFSPLRSPGRTRPRWELVPLTATWGVEGRDAWFEERVTPLLAHRRAVLVLFRGPEVDYFEPFEAWLRARFPGQIEREAYDGTGFVTTARFRLVERPM